MFFFQCDSGDARTRKGEHPRTCSRNGNRKRTNFSSLLPLLFPLPFPSFPSVSLLLPLPSLPFSFCDSSTSLPFSSLLSLLHSVLIFRFYSRLGHCIFGRPRGNELGSEGAFDHVRPRSRPDHSFLTRTPSSFKKKKLLMRRS